MLRHFRWLFLSLHRHKGATWGVHVSRPVTEHLHLSFCVHQVLYKVYISFVEVGPGNVQTTDYFKGVGKSTGATAEGSHQDWLSTLSSEVSGSAPNFVLPHGDTLTDLTPPPPPPQPPSSSSVSGGLWLVSSLLSSLASSLVSPKRSASLSLSLSSCWFTLPTWQRNFSHCPPFCRKFAPPAAPVWPVLVLSFCDLLSRLLHATLWDEIEVGFNVLTQDDVLWDWCK